MPHSSSTTVVTNATNNENNVPLFYGLATPTTLTDYNNKKIFSLSSPVASPVELAPITHISGLMDNRPPSPESPEQAGFSFVRDDRFQTLSFKKKENKSLVISSSSPPAFLEPAPQFDTFSASRLPPTLSTFFKHHPIKIIDQCQQTTIPTLQIPIPRRSHHQTMNYQQQHNPVVAAPITAVEAAGINTSSSPLSSTFSICTSSSSFPSSSPPSSSSPSSITSLVSATELSYPMSPTMAAASASAAASANLQHPGSQVAESLLKAIGVNFNGERKFNLDQMECSPEEEKFRFMSPIGTDPYSKTSVDQNKFLTKNSHIKRPRNAWIHFRCHYGQALKTQDPTLRAEEISKRASRRWSTLSENEKKPWHDLAEQEKLAHREAFPEYRYCPRRSNAPYSPPKRSRTEESEGYSNDKKKVVKKRTK